MRCRPRSRRKWVPCKVDSLFSLSSFEFFFRFLLLEFVAEWRVSLGKSSGGLWAPSCSPGRRKERILVEFDCSFISAIWNVFWGNLCRLLGINSPFGIAFVMVGRNLDHGPRKTTLISFNHDSRTNTRSHQMRGLCNWMDDLKCKCLWDHIF